MNKWCPGCKKPVTKKDAHVFVNGKRYHSACVASIEGEDVPVASEYPLVDGGRFEPRDAIASIKALLDNNYYWMITRDVYTRLLAGELESRVYHFFPGLKPPVEKPGNIEWMVPDPSRFNDGRGTPGHPRSKLCTGKAPGTMIADERPENRGGGKANDDIRTVAHYIGIVEDSLYKGTLPDANAIQSLVAWRHKVIGEDASIAGPPQPDAVDASIDAKRDTIKDAGPMITMTASGHISASNIEIPKHIQDAWDDIVAKHAGIEKPGGNMKEFRHVDAKQVANVEDLANDFNDAVDTIERLKRLVVQFGGIPSEFFDDNNILDEKIARVYGVDPYGKKK